MGPDGFHDDHSSLSPVADISFSMSGQLRNVVFIAESVGIADIFQKFCVFLNLESYETIKVGEYISSELPKGLNFPVLLDQKWFENPEIEVELQKNQDKFAGIIELQQETNNGKLEISGIAGLYNVKNPLEVIEMRCTIVVEKPEVRESMMTKETQTTKGLWKQTEVQTSPPSSSNAKMDVSTNTSGRHTTLEEIQPLLTASIARHLKEHQQEQIRKTSRSDHQNDLLEEDPKDPKPSEKSLLVPLLEPQQVPLNSFNLMPRMTKLRDLDALIAERIRILIDLDMEIDLKRKVLRVKAKREDMKREERPPNNDEKYSDKLQKKDNISTSSDSTSSESSSISDSEPSASTDASDSSDSEKEPTPSSSTVAGVQKPEDDEKIVDSVGVENLDRGEEESTIEDPFSARKSPESPTSAYLNQLKKRIFDQYNQKYS